MGGDAARQGRQDIAPFEHGDDAAAAVHLGDAAGADILSIILRDEIGHVALGAVQTDRGGAYVWAVGVGLVLR